MPEYIERGKLLQDIEDSVVFTAKSGQPSLEIRGANKITARIMAAPAADVVEVRHGEWEPVDLDSDVRFFCSECETVISTSWDYDSAEMWSYCPNCGAKMDGKGDIE